MAGILGAPATAVTVHWPLRSTASVAVHTTCEGLLAVKSTGVGEHATVTTSGSGLLTLTEVYVGGRLSTLAENGGHVRTGATSAAQDTA
jgi:hypothetical protein